MRAPRRRAISSASRIKTPAPSARTNPSRSRSNGRLARVGSSLRVDRALIEANPPRPMWVIAASLPPVTITSAQPVWMSLSAVADRIGRRGARRRHRRARPLQSPADRELAAGGVDHQLGNHERADPRRPLLHHHGVLALKLVEPADARADHHPALFFGYRREIDSGVLDGRDGGGQGELRESIEVPRFLDAKPSDRVPVADLTAELDLELGGIEQSERPDTAPPGTEGRPERFEAITQRRNQPHAGDHDAARMCHDLADGLKIPSWLDKQRVSFVSSRLRSETEPGHLGCPCCSM